MIYNPPINGTIGNFTTANQPMTSLQTFLTNFITIGFGIGTIILVFMLILGSINFIASRGDKDGVQKSTKTISNALIGIVILFSVYVIIKVVGLVFGINVLQITFPRF